MRRQAKTYEEDGVYYPVIQLPNGHTYYGKGCKSRSTAYRNAVREMRKHELARRNNMIYNVKI